VDTGSKMSKMPNQRPAVHIETHGYKVKPVGLPGPETAPRLCEISDGI
jgi:hypothetical protein